MASLATPVQKMAVSYAGWTKRSVVVDVKQPLQRGGGGVGSLDVFGVYVAMSEAVPTTIPMDPLL